MSAANAGAAMAADGIDLIHENDARGVFLRLVEHVADAACADADEHLDKIGTGNREEGAVGFAGNSFGDQEFFLFPEGLRGERLSGCVRQAR